MHNIPGPVTQLSPHPCRCNVHHPQMHVCVQQMSGSVRIILESPIISWLRRKSIMPTAYITTQHPQNANHSQMESITLHATTSFTKLLSMQHGTASYACSYPPATPSTASMATHSMVACLRPPLSRLSLGYVRITIHFLVKAVKASCPLPQPHIRNTPSPNPTHPPTAIHQTQRRPPCQAIKSTENIHSNSCPAPCNDTPITVALENLRLLATKWGHRDCCAPLQTVLRLDLHWNHCS